MTTHYNSSRGPIEIAGMEPEHLLSALAKLQREEPDRVNEIAALQAQADKNRDTLATKMAPYIRAGWRLREAFDALGKRSYNFYNENTPDAQPQNIKARSKDGAWAIWVATQDGGA